MGCGTPYTRNRNYLWKSGGCHAGMDSRVESLDDRLLRLQEEQIQQQQRTQDTLHSTAALEQQLHLTETKMK